MADSRSSRRDHDALGELWSCPKCGRKLVGRNMAHSCSSATVERFLRRAGKRERALYARFERMIAACGPYHVSPAKTRVAFQARVRFANVTALGPRGMRCNFALPHPLASARFVKVEEIVPGWWVHHLHVTALAQLDRELQGWLRRSYRAMGMQERLKKRAPSERPSRGAGASRTLRHPSASIAADVDRQRFPDP